MEISDSRSLYIILPMTWGWTYFHGQGSIMHHLNFSKITIWRIKERAEQYFACIFYLSEDMMITAAGNLNRLEPPGLPFGNNVATPSDERTTPASADTNRSAKLLTVSSGANKRTTESPRTKSLNFCNFQM